MGTMQVTLKSGSGKRCESVWQGRCPSCNRESEFSHEHFGTEVGWAILSGMVEVVTTKGKSYKDLLDSTNATDIIGCSQCQHAMVICPFCNIAFSANKQATLHQCPQCNERLA